MRNFPLSESDKIVLCLTREYGLERLVARGARKLKSKFTGRLEPFTVVELEYRRKEDSELGILRQVELHHSYFHLARKLNVLSAFAYFGELLSEFAPPHEPNETLYRMAKTCFEVLSEVGDETEKISAAVLYCELWLLRLAGYLPDARVCGNCRRSIGNEEAIVWTSDNRFLCRNCGEKRGSLLSFEEAGIFRAAQRFSPAKFVQAVASENRNLEIPKQVTRKLIRQVLLREVDYWSEYNWESVEH